MAVIVPLFHATKPNAGGGFSFHCSECGAEGAEVFVGLEGEYCEDHIPHDRIVWFKGPENQAKGIVK